MTDRTQRFAEITMAHIYSWTDGKKEKTHIKFGPAALRSAVNMIDDSVRITEYNQVLEQLVEQKYLKKLGRHMYGLGTGKGLKRYPISDQSLLSKPTDTGFNNSKTKNNQDTAPCMTTRKSKAEPKAPAAETHKTVTQQAKEVAEQALSVTWKDKTPSPSLRKASNKIMLQMELNDISSRLRIPERHRIQNKDTKVTLLNDLAKLLAPTEPLTADLLNQIKHDLQQGEAA